MAQKNIVVNLDINHADAKKKVTDLTKMYKDLNKQRSALVDAGDTKGVRAVEKQIKDVNAELKIQKLFATDVENVLKNINKAKMTDIYNSLKILRGEFDNMDRNSNKYLETQRKIYQLEAQVASHREKRRGSGEKTMEWVKNAGAILGLGTAISFLKGKGQQAVDTFNEFDDKLADVRKTTGLSQEQVESLSLSLSKIDTRTSQNELLGLSYQAGKLGISAKEDVLEFVDAADKIGVALGDDLGGKEEAINTIGKLVDLFKIKDQYGMADGMLKVGSAINGLGAASTANEGYIVDFASRTGGVGVSAKIAATDLMGLGATFDSLNAEVESSGTVINKVLGGMFSKTEQYAKVAKMEVKEFTELLKTDANEALLKVLEGFKGQDLTYTASMLGEVGENGARALQALSLISGNIAMVREQQALANEEFIKGTGVIDEFDIKNNTAAAKREKAAKEVTEAMREIGRVLSPIYTSFLSGSASVIQVVSAVVKVFWDYKAAILGAGVAYGAYYVVQKSKVALDAVEVAGQKVKVFWTKAGRLALVEKSKAMLAHSVATKAGTATTVSFTLVQKAMAVVNGIVSGSFKAAGIAAKSFWISLGPIGWAITAFTALAGAIAIFGNKTDKAAASQKALNDIHLRAQESVLKESNELERLLDIAKDKTESDQRRADAIKELQTLMPNGIDLINQETIANGKAKKSVDDYCESLLLRAKLEAAKNYLVEYEADRLKKMQEGETDLNWWQTVYAGTIDLLTRSGGKKGLELMRENKAEFEAETNQVTSDLVKHINDLEKTISKKTGTPDIPCPDCGKSPCVCGKGLTDKQKWSLEGDLKFGAAKVALRRQLLEGQIASEQEYNDQLLALEISTLESRLSAGKLGNDEILKLEGDLADKRYTQQKQKQERLKKLQEVIDADKTPLEQEQIRYDKQLRDLGLFGTKREDLTKDQLDALVVLEKNHTKKLSSIYIDSLNKEYDASEKQLSRAITALKEAQGVEIALIHTFADKKRILSLYYSAEELRQITTDKEADKALKAEYDRQELEKRKEHLSKQLALYISMSAEANNYGTVWGDAITEEDAKKMEDIIEKLKKQLADLGVEIQKTPENGKSGVDVFGMTPDQWEETFAKLQEGKASLDDWGNAIGAIGQAMASTFGEVSNLMTAIEQREFAKHEKMSKDEKKRLDKQLNAGVISQEAYNRKIQNLDEQTDVKKQEMEKKQAQRQKAMAIFDALVNTAVAVVGALGSKPFGPWNIALAATIGALGAIQVGTIMAQPLPGAEDGGMLVERSQDGKLFNAGYDPSKRGRVDKPTVIVGENGSEYVVPAEGYENPTIRPVLDIIEMARKNGTLRSINLPQLQTATMFGRQGGGYVSPSETAPTATPQPSNGDHYARFIVVLERTEAVLSKVDDKLSRPFSSYVTINGPSGLAEQWSKYNKQKDNGRI